MKDPVDDWNGVLPPPSDGVVPHTVDDGADDAFDYHRLKHDEWYGEPMDPDWMGKALKRTLIGYAVFAAIVAVIGLWLWV